MNNNRESANNMLKMKTDWKPARLLDLINHLHDLVKLQYADVQRALYDQGNFQLVSPFSRHKISSARCYQASTARRQLLFKSLMSDSGSRHTAKTVTSSDNTFTVTASPRVAWNLMQRKCARVEHTGFIPPFLPVFYASAFSII